ncbi:D-arabinono-1,4-lactone oxidase [soil metagenome]
MNVGTNWAGNYTFGAGKVHSPSSLDELRALVASTPRIRALGTRHSFNDLADTDGDLVTLVGLEPRATIDRERMTVTASAGTRYGELAVWLQREGYALHNMGSLPHISLSGAISTSTHGSGNSNGTLATAVAGLEFVTGGGELLRVDRDHPQFDGYVVGLGAFGIITRVTLDIQPTFDLRQDLYIGLPWDVALEQFEQISGCGYSVSLFSDWLGDEIGGLLVKTRLEAGKPRSMPPTLFGARIVTDVPDERDNWTDRNGNPGPWSARLPHFRLESTPSNGEEIQSEFFVDRRDARAALTAVRELGDQIAPHLIATELRTTAADDLWLSMANGRASLAIHFTWKSHPQAVPALLPQIEAALEPFDYRPHWGKTFSVEQIGDRYARFEDFRALAERHDPSHQFRNAYLERVLGL